MTIERMPVQTLVTISIDSNGEPTHAWKQTTFAIMEDGAEIAPRATGDQENIKPEEIAHILPHADLLQQIHEMTDTIAATRRELVQVQSVLAEAKSALEEANQTIALRDSTIAELVASHANIAARNAAAALALGA